MLALTVVDKKLEVREVPDPQPGTGELLVRVRAAGLNNADLAQARGGYPAPPGSPADIPGLEFAGEVVATGPDVFRFTVGDRVMALVGGGGQAQLAIVHERCALPVPANMDWDAAGGFPEAFITAHDALFTQCRLTMGEKLCVHGAAGGVGIAGVQLGAATGAQVVGTVRNEALRANVAALGCEAIAPADVRAHGPYDVILELATGSNLPDNLASLARWGRVVLIGVGRDSKVELDMRQLAMRNGRILASTLRARPLEEKATAVRAVETQVLPHVVSGRITVPVEARFSLRDGLAAYERFAAGSKFGKIVIVDET